MISNFQTIHTQTTIQGFLDLTCACALLEFKKSKANQRKVQLSIKQRAEYIELNNLPQT